MEWELQFLNWIQMLHNPVLDAILVFFTTIGNAGAVWILLGVVLLIIPKTRKSGLVVLLAILIDVVLCNGILKHLFARIRPCDVNTAVSLLIARPDDYSFPSGHTAVAFAAVTVCRLVGKKRLWIPALVLACVIAFSRMYLYVHYPTDILGGIAVGVISGVLAWLIGRRFLLPADQKHGKRRTDDDHISEDA